MTIFELTRQLASVRRFSRDFSFHQESVLEHLGFCALYSLHIARRLQSDGIEVDIETLLKRALLHDIEEATTGDVNRKVKYHNDDIREAMQTYEEEAAEELCKAVFSRDDFVSWGCAKYPDLEGAIVALADMASVAYHLVNEFNLGNKSMLRVKQEFINFHADYEPAPGLERFYAEIMQLLGHQFGQAPGGVNVKIGGLPG